MATRTRTGNRRGTPEYALEKIVEPRRKQARVSLRDAAERAGISEATWRQLVQGGVMNSGRWVNRTPRRDQVLDMGHAVGCLEEVASELGATKAEVEDARARVVVVDPAQEEIMRARHLTPAEKLRLIERLEELRRRN